MKNERNIDFRAGTSRSTQSVVEMHRHGRYPLFQRGLGGFSSNFNILGRGYTGHEHLLEHKIINMNGRIYDPLLGQFMQADNFIQSPENFLDHNRYAYCRNNPFKYTDPSGEYWVYFDPAFLNEVPQGTQGADCYWVDDDNSMLEEVLARLNAWMNKPWDIRAPQATTPGLPSGGGGGSYGGSQGVGINPDGVYLVGKTPEERARSAEGLSNIIHDQVLYDENTGKILGRMNFGEYDCESSDYELQETFDVMLIMSEENHKRLEVEFWNDTDRFQYDEKNDIGTVYLSSYWLKNDNSDINDGYSYYKGQDGRKYAISFSQAFGHEFGHGSNWINNIYFPGPDSVWKLLQQYDAIKFENIYLNSIKQPLRFNIW